MKTGVFEDGEARLSGRNPAKRVCGLTAFVAGMMLVCAGSASAKAQAWYALSPEPAALARLEMDTEHENGDWRMCPNLELVHDDVLDRKVMEHTGRAAGWIRSSQPLPEVYALTALIRMTQGGSGAVLAAGATGTDVRPQGTHTLSIRPLGERGWRVQTGRAAVEHYLADETRLAGGPLSALPRALEPIPRRVDFGERFSSAPSPLSEEGYRIEIESALAEQAKRPAAAERWHELRIECRPERLRMFVNGVPVGEDLLPGRIRGDAHLQLSGGARVAALEITMLEDEPGIYTPVTLTERLNAKSDAMPGGLSEDVLPRAGGRIEADGIPFLLARDPAGNDHIDLSRSVFRERNTMRHVGYVTGRLWPGPESFDPGRITFAVPNRAYTRIWLIAAFDETPHSVPIVTARFFKPRRGFPVDASAEVPGLSARSAPGSARRLPVRRADGSGASFWLVPIELDAARLASEMRRMNSLSLELTKEVHPFRTYPDPHSYGWFQGGPPSGVRVFAMTFEEAPVRMIASGNRQGNVYVRPEQPVWQVDLVNQRANPVSGIVKLRITDPYDRPAGVLKQEFLLRANGGARLEFPLAASVNGLYTVLTEVEIEETRRPARDAFMSRKGSFLQLPRDTRQTAMQESPWGVYSHDGGHVTHDILEDNLYLLRAAGARQGLTSRSLDVETSKKWGVRRQAQHIGNDQRSAQPWAFEDPYDPEKYAENRDQIGKRIAERFEGYSLTPSFSMFIETAITTHLTYGVPRRYIGEDPEWTEEETRRVRGHMIYGRAVCEGIRMHAPDATIALGWCGANFTEPLLKEGFPRELFDYIGVDEPVFERTPEMPIREVTPNRMWLLRQAMEKYGYEDVPIIHVESYYPSSNPLALGWRRSADHYVRLMTLALAMVPNTTFSGVLTLEDTASAYGFQHYGEHGMLTRWPESNPKPAFAAYATMTSLLDPPEYQGYVPTGSHSVYCLHFTSRGRNVYPMWTLRGRREARLRMPEGAGAIMVDESGNEFPLEFKDGWTDVSLTPTPLWVASEQPVEEVRLGETDHTFVPGEHPMMRSLFADGTGVRYRPENRVDPGQYSVLLDALDKPWNYAPGPYPPHAEGHWGAPRYDGPMISQPVHCEKRGADVWEIKLEEPDVARPLAAWYGVFEPDKPIPVPGKARALGVWADGRSNWGRIVYEIEDASGGIWRSIGTKNDWNCDDIHTWSYFNYDGWRYLEFPLPSHLPYDNYREHDTTWWGGDGGSGVVELPVKLRRIIIEHRTHNIYADELVETPDRSVRLHRLKAVYDNAEAITDAPIELQRAAAGLMIRDVEDAPLPNPIADLRETGVGDPLDFVRLAPPDDYDGLVTRLEIELTPVKGAGEYRIYVAAYKDGRGAQRIAQGEKPVLPVSRLQPGFPLYLFATYMDADDRESRPTPARRILLVDDFPFR